jgi:hypothetical protein
MKKWLDAADLHALDAAMTRAFATGDPSGLQVLGYGEITTVVVCISGGTPYACKRLPPFATPEEASRYSALFEEYIETLAASGVRVVPSQLEQLTADDGSVVLFCVQPVLPAGQLAVRVLERSDAESARRLFELVLGRILSSVTRQVGLDGQLSNWMVDGDDVLFLDVTTPMLKDAAGRDRLDTELFLAAVPTPVRPLFRRFVVPHVIDQYHDPRGVVIDLLANLIKDDLEPYIAPFLELANPRLSRPISDDEVRRYYEGNARVWSAWQAMRRCDRFVRTRLLGKPYPFLLPGPIQRHGARSGTR